LDLSNGTVEPFADGWNNYAHMLFVDQPVKTGFSWTKGACPTSSRQAAEQFHVALSEFFDTQHFASFAKNPFLLTGESYAGKYIPNIATVIHEKNQEAHATKINLEGIAIGDGWVHPLLQNQAYVNYSYATGLLDGFQKSQAQAIADQARQAILSKQWLAANDLSNKLEDFVVKAGGGYDEDDILYGYAPMAELMKGLVKYLNDPETKNMLHVPQARTWAMFNNDAYNALNADEQQSAMGLMPNLIDNYRVMLYTGNMDLNCNLLGVEAWIMAMDWPHTQEYWKSPKKIWRVADSSHPTGSILAGYAKRCRNLTNVIVRDAGHEVPFFQPVTALDMFRRFAQNVPF
jgi:carboxypeptidase C (cathepsin A)